MDTHYRIYSNTAKLKNSYKNLIADNFEYLLNYIYKNYENDIEERIAIAFHIISFNKNKQLSLENSKRILKDLTTLKNDKTYLSKWQNMELKRKTLEQEINYIRKKTISDDTISLNTIVHTNDSAQKEVITEPSTSTSTSTSMSTSMSLNETDTESCALM